jgi:tetratricopeptide (TPR) repeat protein
MEGSWAANMKAIEVNPRFVPALVNVAVSEFNRADIAGAERLIRRCLDIDPQEAFSTSWLCVLLHYTNRHEECFRTIDRLEKIAPNPFYVTGVWVHRAWLHLDQGNHAAAEQAIRRGLDLGLDIHNFRAFSTAIAARSGRLEEARGLLNETKLAGLSAPAFMTITGGAIRIGDFEKAYQLLSSASMQSMIPTWTRLDHEFHPILDRIPFAPRRRDATLVWPLEAPMIDAARFELFREVKIESGRSAGSDIRPG